MSRCVAVLLGMVLLGTPAPSLAERDDAHTDIARGDRDSDGVPDRKDSCNSTPSRARPLHAGCSALDLVLHPGVVITPVLQDLDEARKGLGGSSLTKPVDAALRAARSTIVAANHQIAAGSPCEGRAKFRLGLSKLRGASGDMDQVIADEHASILREDRPDEPIGDADDRDTRWYWLDYLGSLVDRAETSANEGLRRLVQVCNAVERSTVIRDVIGNVEDASRLVVTLGGDHVGLAERRYGADIAKGIRAKVKGLLFDDDSIVATDVDVLDANPMPGGKPPKVTCMFLRVAPFQPFYPPLPTISAPYTLHNPAAYERGGKLLLERDMRLAAKSSGCPTKPKNSKPGQKSKTIRYSLELTIDYQGAPPEQIAWDLTPKDDPVLLPPPPAGASGQGTLEVVVNRQGCFFKKCGAQEMISSETHTIVVVPTGSYCSADYDTTVFTLDDDDETSFQPAVVPGSSVTFADEILGTGAIFQAIGYGYPGGAAGGETTINAGESFAVYNTDFFENLDLLAYAATGVDHPTGLEWPRAIGKRNGYTYWYICQLPTIVRDAVDRCPVAPDSFYRMPWAADVAYNVNQGNNNPSGSHNGNQIYAFDFGTGSNTQLLAARGGTVASIDESQTSPCFPAWCPGNNVFILHEDGTFGVYYHLAENSVTVDVDDRVFRGDPIAESDNTGRSTGAHLHWQVQTALGNTTATDILTIQVSFETKKSDCVIPVTGDDPISTNVR